ncbi:MULTISPECIES: sugar phosphate isomerase/epimerase [unclassified Variovorax]|jgi:sugar phosphate isomerase/epimerase|uniref:sugar phosphate isomerase/epimerase family protein n=1 Tax=unclassified Variovorax TaxID=663243 RepID=UPI0008B5CD84|nr:MULTISPECIES: TIM barrel protein [unclassified Variovorax]SEJ59852.1 Sugar phosphate isomerase/epimerase [Variovorax sp. OK202]SFC66106.1 Sugar phosphate isomerase/epimerase [Variovorax sp. OK212]
MNFRLSLAHLGMLDATPPRLVEAAHAAGFGGVGIRLSPARLGEAPFPMAVGSGMLRETLARLRDLGLRVHDIEIVRIKPGFDAASLAGVLASAEALGARCLMVNVDDSDLARAGDGMAALAERARPHGLALGVEFMVYTAARSLQQAQQLVAASNSDTARVVVDALHFFRAGCAPSDMEGDRGGARIDRHFMQVNDALAQRHPGLSPAEEGRAHRLFPGEGELPVHRLLAQLAPDALLSVEAPSAIRMATLDPLARAAAAFRATSEFLQRNGHTHA